MKLAYAFRNTVFYPYFDGGRRLPPLELRSAYLSKVRSLGFDGIELSFDSVGGWDAVEDEVRELRLELENAELPCVAVRCPGLPKKGDNVSRRVELLQKGVEVAGWIGAEILDVTVTTPITRGHPGDSQGQAVSQGSSRLASESDFDETSSLLAEAADLAAASGLAVSIEMHHHSIADNSWSSLKLLKAVNRPNVGINPDIKNMVWAYDTPDESPEDAILALAPYANYWHCMNITRLPLASAGSTVFLKRDLSGGEINFRFLIAAMLDAGYSGYMAIEGAQYGDQLHIDGRSAAYARSLIDELSVLQVPTQAQGEG